MTYLLKMVALGGGCFWCTEAVFKMLNGILTVKSGYAGGSTNNPTYDQVSAGKTGHAEVVYLEYDPSQINFKDILTVFFASHDPSSVNRQGNDIGSQYRSIILYTDQEQKGEAEKLINELNKAPGNLPIVTELAPLGKFYEAELYHQDYYDKNSNAPYCQLIINPKLDHIRKDYENLLKKYYERQKT